jgi:hypothetical protein
MRSRCANSVPISKRRSCTFGRSWRSPPGCAIGTTELCYAIGGYEEPSEYFHPVISVATIGALMSRLYSAEGLRRESMLAARRSLGRGEIRS